MTHLAHMLRVVDHDPRRHGAGIGALADLREHSFAERPAVLLRGFPVRDEFAFRDLAQAASGDVTPYLAGQTDRTEVATEVYEATKVPSIAAIPLHSEMAYSTIFPRSMFFWCRRRRCVGGASWLASNAAIHRHLPERLRRRLDAHGARYRRLLPPRDAPLLRWVRRLRTGALKSWQESLGVEDRDGAERALTARGVPFTWTAAGWLDLSVVLPAFRPDPATGEPLWFNQIPNIHVSRAIYGRLLATGHAALIRCLATNPLDAEPADGEGLTDDDTVAIAAAMRGARAEIVLREGDVLWFDNLRLSHGRAPYLGVRQVRVVFCGLGAS